VNQYLHSAPTIHFGHMTISFQ